MWSAARGAKCAGRLRGPPLAGQHLRPWASTAGCVGSVPRQGTETPHTMWLGQKVKQKKLCKENKLLSLLNYCVKIFDIKSARVPGAAQDMTAMCKCSKENKMTRAQSGTAPTKKTQQAQAAGLKGRKPPSHKCPSPELETKPLAKRSRASEANPSPGQGCGIQGHSGRTAPPPKASPSCHRAGDAVGWAGHRRVCHGAGGSRSC